MGLWEEEREKINQLAVNNFQRPIFDLKVIFCYRSEHGRRYRLRLY